MNKHVPIGDIARKLSCSPETIRRLCRSGELPCVKVGRDWRIDPEQVTLSLSHSRTIATKRN
jgi:excisionase family DNA binding protein